MRPLKPGDKKNNILYVKELDYQIANRKAGLFQCFCGNLFESVIQYITGNKRKSCGCLHSTSKRKHGHAENGGSPEYHSYQSMINRCTNPKAHNWANYGGRGITICKEWLNDFNFFLKDMGLKPTNKHSIDRIDNNLGYFPENCKWSTSKEQANNKRNSRKKLINTKPTQNEKEETN